MSDARALSLRYGFSHASSFVSGNPAHFSSYWTSAVYRIRIRVAVSFQRSHLHRQVANHQVT